MDNVKLLLCRDKSKTRGIEELALKMEEFCTIDQLNFRDENMCLHKARDSPIVNTRYNVE